MSVFSGSRKPASERGGVAPTSSRVMAATESPSARRFGEVLVHEGFITSVELEQALRLQAASRIYVPIGQVLLAEGFITRRQLTTLLYRHGKRSRLGDVLIKAGRISPAQLDAALALQRRTRMPIGQALITLGAVNEMTMRDALCTQLHINLFDVDPIGIDRRLAGLISERYATRHLIVPLFRVGDILVVAMDDPSDTERIERLEFNLGLQIEVVMTTMEKLQAAIRRLYEARVPADVDVFARRNILIGPLRDHLVAELAERGLRGVSVASFG